MRRLALVLLLSLTACSGSWKSDALLLEMELPKGFDAPKVNGNVADFGRGLKIVRVDGAVPELPLVEWGPRALQSVPNPEVAKITSNQAGSLAGQPAKRFDLKEGSTRGLLYVVTRGDRYYVLFAASEDDAQLSRVERAFGTLRFR